MFDLAWSEILVIAVVALVVIGPKELPLLLRNVGQWIRKARSLASEFQSGIDQMARDAEIADLRKQVEQAKDYATGKIMDPQSMIDPDGEIRRVLEASQVTPPPEPVIEPLPAETPEANVPVEQIAPTVAETADPMVEEEPVPAKKPRKPRKPKEEETSSVPEEPTRG
jgi:sec-independent protein translocase protein TatB